MAHQPQDLGKILRIAIQDFMQSTGVNNIEEVPAHASCDLKQTEFSASLGFGGEKMKGALIIVSPASCLQLTNPQREQVPILSEADHRDWVGEMSNQVVGNLKRVAAGYGVDFSLSTPTVIRGSSLTVLSDENSEFIKLKFRIGEQDIQFFLNAKATPDVSFQGEPTVVAHQAAGGDAMLF
jgi:CheY-specific phosphatase CheX